MAAGTGRVLADLVSGRTPEISMEGLTMARYQRNGQFAGAAPRVSPTVQHHG
jgi:glycine/D-amino acid oxidase-like deaminating enzyme